jgi:protocatechuate 3,4-dioxygenase beta subunit
VFAAYVAFILALAVAGPGMTVLASEGEAAPQPLAEEVPQEVLPEVPAEDPPEAPAEEPIEAPAEEPAPLEDPVPADEPEGDQVELQASVEAPVATVAALLAPAKAEKDEDDNSWICAGGVKLDGEPRTGTYTWDTSGTEETPTTPSDYEISIVTSETDDGMVMSFTSNYPVTKVRVKGGNGYLDFDYTPGVLSGSGLHAPVNASGDYADISHIVFCFDLSEPHDSHIIVMKFRDDVVTNGEHDGGENWLEGFAFDLYEGESETGPWAKVATETTAGSNGQADFGMWPTGWYKIVEVLSPAQIAAGETPTSGDPLGEMVFYHTGQVNSEKRFGNIIEEEPPEEGDLVVYKFHDLDEDGEYDDGEPMLEGWEFEIFVGQSLTATGTTGADGSLSFPGLDPGEYSATEKLLSGWVNTTPLTQKGTVVDGETTEVWFGNIEEELPPEEGDLVIYKFHDLDEDGVYDDGEPMLEDWEFTVTVESEPILEDQITPSAIMLIGTGLTDENGMLEFTGLAPAEYTITETLKDGWVNTTPLTQKGTVVDGETTEVWFGNIEEELPPEEGDLVIYKFHDLDEDGVYDDGEPMLEDWEFTVTVESEPILEDQITPSAIMLIGTGLTDENGMLEFTGLAPAEYTITETLKDGWVNTTPLTQKGTVVDGETTEVWFGNIEEFLPFTELDLAITKVADRDSAAPGALVTYTLTYWNNGELAAENYTIVDDFDERYVTVVDANGGVVSGGKITWTMAGPLALEDGKQTLTYTVRIDDDMPDGRTNVDNVVVIDHPQDADPTNNTDDERVVVRVSEQFLPFTGTEAWLLLAAALAAGTAGLALRLAPRKTS